MRKAASLLLAVSVALGGTAAFPQAASAQPADGTAAEAPVDPRGEERTYASFPEWYIVYQAQEYGTFVRGGGRPSQFPYFASIRQYWESVRHTRAALGDVTIDSSTDTVLRVIGVSFTVENAVIGAYEATAGRLFEALNLSAKTTEDRYADAVAAEYGAFLLHTPWYAFPYGQKLAGLWRTFGRSSLTARGLERRAAFTAGYAIKGLYGFVLGRLSQSSLGAAELETSFEAANISERDLRAIEGLRIDAALPGGRVRATGPRYRAFTGVVQAVAAAGGTFVTIEGHSRIMLTVLAVDDAPCLAGLDIEFSMPLLTQPGVRRYAVTADVRDLARVVRRLAGCGLPVEHVYDY